MMRPLYVRTSLFFLAFLSSEAALAKTYYVGPAGANEECTRAAPCALTYGAEHAVAGDTVILMDGIYTQPLNPEISGTPDAWITFRADDCALPIIEGAGENAVKNVEGHFPSGVFTNTGSYLRFIGIVSRYWDSGFTNGWTGGETLSNGFIEYINCIGDGNHRTAFAMYSAENFKVRQCIAAHSGGSPTNSWSSGVQLYDVRGTSDDNVIESTVSFENTDGQKGSDGSGFIVDEHTEGSGFYNNIAFGNGGSCLRLTRSSNTKMVNFSCYHNGNMPVPAETGPSDPGEFYFTDDISRESGTVVNSLIAASGTDTDPAAFVLPPETGIENNLAIDSGPTPFFSDPDGMNPDFRPPSTAAVDVENLGSAAGGPATDIGFDPKCIVRGDPQVPYQQAWWTYSIDYEYIKSLGGVAQCFHPKARAGGVDLGAYELSGEAHQFSVPGACVPGPEIINPATGGGGGVLNEGVGGNAIVLDGAGGGGDPLPGSVGGSTIEPSSAGGSTAGGSTAGASTGGEGSGPTADGTPNSSPPTSGGCSLGASIDSRNKGPVGVLGFLASGVALLWARRRRALA